MAGRQKVIVTFGRRRGSALREKQPENVSQRCRASPLTLFLLTFDFRLFFNQKPPQRMKFWQRFWLLPGPAPAEVGAFYSIFYSLFIHFFIAYMAGVIFSAEISCEVTPSRAKHHAETTHRPSH